MSGKKKAPSRKRTKDRISLRDAVIPAAIVTLAAVEQGSQGGAPVLEELTTYVMDDYDAHGLTGAVQQVGTGLADFVEGAVSIEGAAIIGGAALARHFLGRHGKRLTVGTTAHHRVSLGG